MNASQPEGSAARREGPASAVASASPPTPRNSSRFAATCTCTPSWAGRSSAPPSS
ncbi:hypothetical protein ACU686_28335 [Yinghuangia aomiensis]